MKVFHFTPGSNGYDAQCLPHFCALPSHRREALTLAMLKTRLQVRCSLRPSHPNGYDAYHVLVPLVPKARCPPHPTLGREARCPPCHSHPNGHDGYHALVLLVPRARCPPRPRLGHEARCPPPLPSHGCDTPTGTIPNAYYSPLLSCGRDAPTLTTLNARSQGVMPTVPTPIPRVRHLNRHDAPSLTTPWPRPVSQARDAHCTPLPSHGCGSSISGFAMRKLTQGLGRRRAEDQHHEDESIEVGHGEVM